MMVLRQSGITLYGPDIPSTFPVIPDIDFVQAIAADGQASEEQLLSNPVYTILSPWRVIAYFETKEILTKVQAGYYALEQIDKRFERLVNQAILHYEQADDNTNQDFKLFTSDKSLLKDYSQLVATRLNRNKQ